MTMTSARTRLRRGAAAGISFSVAALGLAAVAPAAQAAATVTYSCTSQFYNADIALTIDTNAPAKVYVGDKADVVVTATGALPSNLAGDAYGSGYRSFDGTVTAKASIGTTNLDVPHSIPRTTIPNQTPPTPATFTATSGALPFAPTAPGVVDVKVGDLTAALTFYSDTSTPVSLTLNCTAPPGQPAVVDTVAVVYRTSTTLTLSKTATKYGQDVTATAKVVGTGAAVGAGDGDVAFSVDGKITTAKVDKDGVATLVLPDTAVGGHSVTATFVPKDAARFDGSASAAQVWDVAKARTKLRVPVTGKRTGKVTKVGVKAKGAFGTVPTGKVKIKLKRLGNAGRWVKVRKLSDTGAAKAGFGKLKAGRYKVTVKYRGDTNHDRARKLKTFRVTRG